MSERGHYGNRSTVIGGGQGAAVKSKQDSDTRGGGWSTAFLLGIFVGPVIVGFIGSLFKPPPKTSKDYWERAREVRRQRIVREHPDWDVARVEAEVERALLR